MWSDWLVFCDVVFTLSALWWRRIRGLWKLPNGRDWLRGKLGLVLMGGAMLSKSLIQFSVDWWGCVPFLLFGLRPNYGRGNGNTCDLLRKDLCQHCCIQCPQQATVNSCLQQRLLDTHSQVWLSPLWGHCSFLLGPGTHKFLFSVLNTNFLEERETISYVCIKYLALGFSVVGAQ